MRIKNNINKNILNKSKRRAGIIEEFEILAKEMKVTGLRPRTIDNYRYNIKRFAEYNEIHFIDEINREHILMYISAGNVSNTTAQNRLKSLRAVFLRFAKKELMTTSFWDDIKVKVNKEIKHSSTESELYMLLHLLDFEMFAQFRDAVGMMTIWETGVRIGTVSRLEKKMIDFENKLIHIDGSIIKNHKGISLPISTELSSMIKTLIETNESINPKSPYLFITERGTPLQKDDHSNVLSQRIAYYKRQFGLKNINAHSLRRGFAKRLLDKDVNIAIISKALGHQSLETTSRYLNISNEELIEELRKLDK